MFENYLITFNLRLSMAHCGRFKDLLRRVGKNWIIFIPFKLKVGKVIKCTFPGKWKTKVINSYHLHCRKFLVFYYFQQNKF